MTHTPKYFTKSLSPQVNAPAASRPAMPEQARRQRSQPLPGSRILVSGLVLALILSFIVHATALAAFTNTTASIGGQTTVTAYAGGVLTVDVTASRNNSTDYDGTSYRWGTSGPFTCVDTPDNPLGSEGTATDTEQISVDVPLAPGTYTLQVRAHSESNCDTEQGGEVGATVSLTVNVIAGDNNIDLVPACGIDVILVLDESGSIASANAIGDVRNAANAFLTGLSNTGSRVAIIEFNTQARQVFGYIDVNTASLPGLQNYVNDGGGAPEGYDPSEYGDPDYFTNWDDAFAKVEARNSASGVAPLVVFITDGDPTAYDQGNNINSSGNYPADDPRLVKAIEGANAVKAQGSHILAVGVGAGISSAESQARLKMISGPDVYEGIGSLDIATTDLILVSDYSGLTSALEQIVSELCRSSVTISKLVDPGTGVYSPGPGWEFSALTRCPQPDGTDFTWTLPNTTTNAADVITSTTDISGVITFQWNPIGSQGESSIVITETAQANYKLESVVCEKTSGSGTIAVTKVGNSFSITGIAIDAIVTCVVKNKLKKIDLELDKSVNNGTPDIGGQVIFTVDVTNQGPDNGTGITVKDNLPSGYTYVSDDSGGAYNSSSGIWTIGDLAVHDTTTLKITASVKASGVYTNYAQVWTANEDDIDSTPGNDSTNEDDDDTAVTMPTPIADLELDKRVNNDKPAVDEEIIFTVVVTNTGPNNASGVTVNDKLPSGYTYVGDDSGGAYDSSSGVWTIGNLAVNASATLKLTVTVNAAGQHLNYAQVETSNEEDPDSTPGNDSDDEDDDDTQGVTVRASLGDKVWFDENRNGIQDLGEPGVPNVTVNLYRADNTFVATAVTNPTGGYLFTNLEPGSYYVEFTASQGYQFTQYDVNSNSLDTVDSDAQSPTIAIDVTDHDEEGELGANLTYTILYTNTDATLQATNLVITTTVPSGTTFVAANSTSGWSCSDVNEGGICTFTVPTLAAHTSGSLNFVVKLKDTDAATPDTLVLEANLTANTPAHSQIVTLAAGEDNRTVDAGIVHTFMSEQTSTPTNPTSLPHTDQPKQQRLIFLPSVQGQP